MGPDQMCYQNVKAHILREGDGRPVYGWSLLEALPTAIMVAGKNKFAKYSLEAHCVCELEGRLVDVTGGGHCKFIRDDDVQPYTNGNLFFCDNDECMEKQLAKCLAACPTDKCLVVHI